MQGKEGAENTESPVHLPLPASLNLGKVIFFDFWCIQHIRDSNIGIGVKPLKQASLLSFLWHKQPVIKRWHVPAGQKPVTGHTEHLMDRFSHVSFAAHAPSEIAVVKIAVMAGLYQVEHLLRPVGECLVYPITKNLGYASVQPDYGEPGC